jgi:hypothetical protein
MANVNYVSQVSNMNFALTKRDEEKQLYAIVGYLSMPIALKCDTARRTLVEMRLVCTEKSKFPKRRFNNG